MWDTYNRYEEEFERLKLKYTSTPIHELYDSFYNGISRPLSLKYISDRRTNNESEVEYIMFINRILFEIFNQNIIKNYRVILYHNGNIITELNSFIFKSIKKINRLDIMDISIISNVLATTFPQCDFETLIKYFEFIIDKYKLTKDSLIFIKDYEFIPGNSVKYYINDEQLKTHIDNAYLKYYIDNPYSQEPAEDIKIIKPVKCSVCSDCISSILIKLDTLREFDINEIINSNENTFMF